MTWADRRHPQPSTDIVGRFACILTYKRWSGLNHARTTAGHYDPRVVERTPRRDWRSGHGSAFPRPGQRGQDSSIEMAIEGQSASASRTAMPSSPTSNMAGAIRWQYAEPTHRSRSTVIFMSPASTRHHGRGAVPPVREPRSSSAKSGELTMKGDRKGCPTIELHVLVAGRRSRQADRSVARDQLREQCFCFHPRQSGAQAEVGTEAE